jgi:hypothetical protein
MSLLGILCSGTSRLAMTLVLIRINRVPAGLIGR